MIKTLVRVFAFIYSHSKMKKVDAFLNVLYTYWVSTEFKVFGNGSFIAKPLNLVGGKYITIGDKFSCDQRLRIDAIDQFLEDDFSPSINIGDNVSIQKDCHIACINKIHIGNNVLMASKVYISDHSHGSIDIKAIQVPPANRRLFSKGPIIIEDNVWLGEGVIVLPNVKIGKNSIVGANAVVTKSIPENCVAAGNPAKIIKFLV